MSIVMIFFSSYAKSNFNSLHHHYNYKKKDYEKKTFTSSFSTVNGMWCMEMALIEFKV